MAIKNLHFEKSFSKISGSFIKAIKTAIERDIGSGGKEIQVAVIDKNGYRDLSSQELKKYL